MKILVSLELKLTFVKEINCQTFVFFVLLMIYEFVFHLAIASQEFECDPTLISN